jgi:hypothetical protein
MQNCNRPNAQQAGRSTKGCYSCAENALLAGRNTKGCYSCAENNGLLPGRRTDGLVLVLVLVLLLLLLLVVGGWW